MIYKLLYNTPIVFCVILANLIICYIFITVLHVYILLNKIKSNQINIKKIKCRTETSRQFNKHSFATLTCV